MSAGDYAIIALIALALFFAWRYTRKKKKQGGGCCGSCSSCPMAGGCERKKQGTDNKES